jgi:putative FmdB family regulatory protein
MGATVPVYEYECERCGERFEELVRSAGARPPCPRCGAVECRRLISLVSPPGRQPRGPRVRDSESRRREREAKRAAGDG